jgi:hypothetical protein
MANSYTTKIKLAEPASGDRTWNVPLNSNFSTIDALAPAGGLLVTTHEQPSSSLLVDIAAGNFVAQDGSVGGYNGTSGQAIGASSTKVLYLDGTNSWALTIASTYPGTPHVRLATVVTTGSTISSITDNRQCFDVCGSVADGVVWTLGTATGLKIGGANNQKLGFYGVTPATQPVLGAATAGATYGVNEQTMLQNAYDALRTLGLGS